MGDRFFLTLECSYCYEVNTSVYYAPSSDFTTFICDKCGKENDIIICYSAERKSDQINNS